MARRGWPVLTMIFVLLLLVGSGAWPTASSGQPGPSVPVHPEVHGSIQRQGSARVIVELRMPAGAHAPEGTLSSQAAVAAQRLGIASARAGALARLHGTGHRVVREYRTVPFVALEVDDNALRALEAAPFDVLRVYEDTVATPQLRESGPLVQADQTSVGGFAGTGMTVAVIDTGIDGSHPFLSGKVVEEACFSAYGQCPNGQMTQFGPGAGVPCSASSCYHGTHVAGIATGNGTSAEVDFSGVAPHATLMAVQVMNDVDGAGTLQAFWSDIIAALEHIYEIRDTHQFASVNISLGTGTKFTAPCDGDPLKPAIDNLRSVGIATVASAGNSQYRDGIGQPACISSVVSVGASNKNDEVAWFSNMASFMSLLAPGDQIYSSMPATSPLPYSHQLGTSMAAPHVAGAWAVLRQVAPAASVSEILGALQETGLPITDTRDGGTVTRPRINVVDAVDLFLPGPLKASITSPVNGATVTGTFTVKMRAWAAEASPIQFTLTLDDAALSSQSVTSGSTATFDWDTSAVSIGSHTLTLTVTDGTGQMATDAIVVTVSHSAPPPSDLTPPTVTITAPSNGAWTGNSIFVNAQANDAGGFGKLELWGNGSIFASQSPCSGTLCAISIWWVTGSLPNGAYEIQAKATDKAGNCTLSAPVTIYKNAKTPVKASGAPPCGPGADPTPPTVTLTAPAAGSTVSGTVTVSATASDNVGVVGVQFRVNAGNLGAEDASAPYSVSWDTKTMANGTHTLTAAARDAAGHVTTSAPVTVTVDNTSPPPPPPGDPTPPTVTITAPAGGSTVTGTVTVSATASDNVGVAGVQFKLDGANLGAEVTTAPYSVPWDTKTAANGSHTLTAVARDAAGNTATSVPVTVTVDNSSPPPPPPGDPTPPTVVINNPSNGAWTGNSIGVKATATDNVGLASIKVYGNGGVILQVTCSGTSCTLDSRWTTGALAPGAYEMNAVATDTAGNCAVSPTVTIYKDAKTPVKPSGVPSCSGTPPPPDSTPPTASITSPAGGATVSGTVTVSATASDNVSVVGVQFKLDGANLGAEDTSAPYAVSWDTKTVANGTHTLTAVARDAAGNLGTSAPVTVTVNNPPPGGGDPTPPTLTITNPSNGAWTGNSIRVAATASDNVGLATLKFFGNGTQFAQTSCNGATPCSGEHWWLTGSLPSGKHTITVVATDTAGNQTSASVTINK